MLIKVEPVVRDCLVSSDGVALQEAIHKQKASLQGVPEGLRKEASELRAQLSCMGLLDRLEGLKGSLASASEADSTVPGDSGEANSDGMHSAMTALYTAEQTELDADLQELMSALNVRTILIHAVDPCGGCPSHVAFRCVSEFSLPQDAKETAAKLETDKMRLHKELLELQLLMNSGYNPAEPEVSNKLPCIPETCTESDSGSPRISAVAEDDNAKPGALESVP